MASGGSWATLFADDGSTSMPEFAPSFDYINVISQGFGASSQSVTPVANRLIALALPKYSKIYATADLALDAIRVMDSTFGGVKVHLLIVQGTLSQYYLNCSLQKMVPNIQGKSVEFSLTFQCESVTNVAPT